MRAATDNVESYLKKKRLSFPKSCDFPLLTSHMPELDDTPELSVEDVPHFQSLVGVLRWIVELGRVDICLEASMVAICVSFPCGGHLEMIYRTFDHLKRHHNEEMGFDPSKPSVNNNDIERNGWRCSEFNSAIKKESELHPTTPTTRAMGFNIVSKMDADHAGDTVRRRPRKGFIVYLNIAPVCLHSKKQNIVETSSFGSGVITMKQLCEHIQG